MELKEFEITEELRGHLLSFKTTYGLFSYKEIDKGTKLLLDSINVNEGSTSLDLGCGYGPIGIILGKMDPTGEVYMVDRDFVAVEHTKLNCRSNNVTNAHPLLSNGFSNLGDLKFDLIASNLPSHISNEMLSWMIHDSKNFLAQNGEIYVVTVSKLSRFIKELFEEVFGNYERIAKDSKYTVSFAKL